MTRVHNGQTFASASNSRCKDAMPNGFGVRAGMPNFGSVIVRAPRVESVVGCVLLVGNFATLNSHIISATFGAP